MRYSFIEMIIAILLLTFIIQSCRKETTPEYELGRYVHSAQSEFKKGFQAEELTTDIGEKR